MTKNHIEIKTMFMDVDGTLTDGKIYMSDSGELFKVFDIKDGYGIHNILKMKEVEPVIITGRKSIILENRCKEIGIKKIYQEILNKAIYIKKYMSENKLLPENCSYIGDDMNDLESMRLVKYRGCPNDAVAEIKKICNFISQKNGGNGAVREFIEWI